jgi:hypothetical protein
MPASSADGGGQHVYRTGLSSACRSLATRGRLRAAVRACHAIKFTTLEILAAYAPQLAESGADWELTNESSKEIQNLQSFLLCDNVTHSEAAVQRLHGVMHCRRSGCGRTCSTCSNQHALRGPEQGLRWESASTVRTTSKKHPGHASVVTREFWLVGQVVSSLCISIAGWPNSDTVI